MFSFVLVSHPLCAVFRCLALYLAPVLSVFVCVFLYWVHPLVMILTFVASVFRVGVHSIGCALRAPDQTLTSVPEREVKRIFSYGVFSCAPFGRLTGPSRRSFGGGVNAGPWGGENAVFLFANCFLFVSWGNYIPVTIPNPSVDIHRTLPNFWSIFSSHWRPSPRCCWRHLHEGVTTLELVLVDERCPLEKAEFTKDVSFHFTDPELKPENTSPTTVQTVKVVIRVLCCWFFSFWIHTFPFLCVFQQNFPDSSLHCFCDKNLGSWNQTILGVTGNVCLKLFVQFFFCCVKKRKKTWETVTKTRLFFVRKKKNRNNSGSDAYGRERLIKKTKKSPWWINAGYIIVWPNRGRLFAN